jgi:isopenicillin N synthase-like dioxygenase
MFDLPTINLEAASNSATKAEAIATIRAACQDKGFLVISHHGISKPYTKKCSNRPNSSSIYHLNRSSPSMKVFRATVIVVIKGSEEKAMSQGNFPI